MPKVQLAFTIKTLIQDGKSKIEKQKLQSKSVIVIGMTNAGKSTLLNYINNIQLESYLSEHDAKYKLKIKNPKHELPGMAIGHSENISCTRFPGLYTPLGKTFTYIDTPGFGDPGDKNESKLSGSPTKAERDIANAYFRKFIVEQANEFKIVIVIRHEDIGNRSGKLPKVLKDLSYFMKGVDTKDKKILEKIKNSICLVVTNVCDMNQEVSEIESEINDLNVAIKDLSNQKVSSQASSARLINLKNIKEKKLTSLKTTGLMSAEQIAEKSLKEYMNNAPSLKGEDNIIEILAHIINQKRFAVFTTPIRIEDKNFNEAKIISNLIENKINFIDKKDANFDVKVSDENAGEILLAINELTEIAKSLAKTISLNIGEKLQSAFNSKKDETVTIQKIKRGCEAVKRKLIMPRSIKDFFEEMHNEIIFSEDTIKQCREFAELVIFLFDLIPKSASNKHSYVKNWVNELSLQSVLDKYMLCANDMVSKPHVNFVDGNLVVQGYYIKISQVQELIKNYHNLIGVELHALHTITIDSDFNANINLSMISPNIAISNHKNINLSGNNENSELDTALNGFPGADAHASGPGAACNNGQSGGNGTDGKPGKSGSSAGNLFIVCDNFIGKENLQVYLYGGNGAKGQDGGKGGNGGRGSDPNFEIRPYPNPKYFPPIIEDAPSPNGWIVDGEHIKYGHGSSEQGYKFPGGEGGKGGNGGRGGKGGSGGEKGECLLIVGYKYTNFGKKFFAENGKAGVSGNPGEAGTGGNHGQDGKGKRYWGPTPGPGGWHGGAMPHLEPNQSKIENGIKPQPNDLNAEGLINSTQITKQNFHLVLLNYKIFLKLSSLKFIGVLDGILSRFENQCLNLKVNIGKTTVNNFLDEAKNLENYFTKYNGAINFSSLYGELLTRIKQFILTSESTGSEIKVLYYLYAATLSNIVRINSAKDNLLIIDISRYVDNLIKGDFAALKSLKNNELKNFYNKQYQNDINVKIMEAKSFLEILKKDIQEKQKDIEIEILKLKKEINSERSNGSSQIVNLNDKRKQLQDDLNRKMIFGIIGLVVQAVGTVFSPVGVVVANAINAGLSMAENPSFENVMNFISKASDIKTEVENLNKEKKSLNKDKLSEAEKDLIKEIHAIYKKISPIIQDAKNILEQSQSGSNQLAKLDAEISIANAYIKSLDAYLTAVPGQLNDYLVGAVDKVKDFHQNLKNKSLIGLEFSHLEINHFFDALKQNVEVFIGKFGSNEGFINIVRKLSESIDISINIHARAEEHRERMHLANFITHMHTANIEAIIVDEIYQEHVSDLELRIKQNILQEAYQKALVGVSQWAFPFADKFMKSIPNLDAKNYENMARNLPIIHRAIENSKQSINNIDNAIIKATFNVVPPALAFYTWNYEQNAKKIESLLRGEKVIFTANVFESELDGVKFSKIGLKFECDDKIKQSEIDKLLEDNFEVILQHNGISYYKLLDDIYSVSNDQPIEIRCSFKTNSQTQFPEIYNASAAKMAHGDLVLSPYTSWIIQINPLPGAKLKKINLLDKLNNVKHDIKIHLIGEGSYIDTSKISCELNLDNYYHKISKSEFNGSGAIDKLYSFPASLHEIENNSPGLSSVSMNQSKLDKLAHAKLANAKKSTSTENRNVSETIELNIPGLTYQAVPGDGHCFYHAVSLYLGKEQATLRSLVAAHLEKNVDYFRHFIQEDRNYADFVHEVREGGEWADNVEIQALMRVLKRPIVIIDSEKIIRNKDAHKEFKNEPIFVYYNGHGHYDALIKTKGTSSNEIMGYLVKFNEDSSKDDLAAQQKSLADSKNEILIKGNLPQTKSDNNKKNDNSAKQNSLNTMPRLEQSQQVAKHEFNVGSFNKAIESPSVQAPLKQMASSKLSSLPVSNELLNAREKFVDQKANDFRNNLAFFQNKELAQNPTQTKQENKKNSKNLLNK